jgi:peptidoglycan hydrolase-like protein with peptidoglycan-binding domain
MTGKPAWRFFRPALLVGLPLVAVAVTATVMLPRDSQPQSPSAPAPTQAVPVSPAPPPRPSETTIKLAPPPPAAAPAPEPSPSPAPTSAKPTNTADWMALPIDDLRAFAHGGDLRAMEELARRLVSGVGVPQDSQSGAGWLLRAAEAGSPSAAFNVGVMYERGFVVARDSTKAVEWYQKAADGNVAVAKHNLALLLRDGKGAPRDDKKAIELLHSAALQGVTGSMFLLGDIYERGDAATKDAPLALAWFAVTVEFERQVNHAAETPLARTAQQRVETLHRILTPAELERAEKLGQAEFQQILAAVSPPKTEPPPGAPLPAATGRAALPAPPTTHPAPPPDDDHTIGWPNSAIERVRTVQQVLIDLRRLNGKADGVAGPATRAAIIDFEKSVGMRETGEPSREVYVAALHAVAQHDVVARSPLPPPPRSEPPKAETPASPKLQSLTPPSAKVEVPAPSPRIDLGNVEPPPPPPTPEDTAKVTASLATPSDSNPSAPKVEPVPPLIELGKAESGPPPPTSADIARSMPKTESPKPDQDDWPTKRSDQIRAIQAILGQLKLMRAAPTGEVGPITFAAIREYQRMAGLPQTGEPSRELFESLKATRSATAPRPDKPD